MMIFARNKAAATLASTFAVLCFVSACTPVPITGAGTTNRGESLVGEILVGPSNAGNHLFIRSPQGWICRSIYLDEDPRLRVFRRDIPLICSNGVKGIASVKGVGNTHRMNIDFLLEDGTSGKVMVVQN